VYGVYDKRTVALVYGLHRAFGVKLWVCGVGTLDQILRGGVVGGGCGWASWRELI